MFYGLVYFPKIQNDRINLLRKKYDPTFDLIEPHLTLLFPVPSSVGKNNLINHIIEVLNEWKPFEINFKRLVKSWDHWLFLAISVGESKVKKLSEELYSGILSKFRRKDIEFIPHIALGLFVKDKTQYDLKNPEEIMFDNETFQKASLEAKSMKFNFNCIINNLDLVEINENFSEIKIIKRFMIG